jgi:preprotein translocase subunit SecE
MNAAIKQVSWRVTDRSRAAIIFGRAVWIGRPAPTSGTASDGATETFEMLSPFEFIQQVRAEANKVTWPTRRETLITTGLVLFLVVVAAFFFTLVDEVLRLIVTFILALGR